MSDELVKSVAELTEELRKQNARVPERQPKEIWDRLAQISTFLSSVVLGTVGLVFTNCYNARQAGRDELLREQQVVIQQIDLLHKFMPQLTGTEEEKRIALLAMTSLGNAKLAASLAVLDPSRGAHEALESIAASGSREEQDIARGALANYQRFAPKAGEIVGGSSRGRRALTRALEELRAGSFETGDNTGPRIVKYLEAAHLPGNTPWSAAFVSWCFVDSSGHVPFSSNGSFLSMQSEFRKRGWLHSVAEGYTPQAGDVVIIEHRSAGETFPRMHGGILLRFRQDSIDVVEGNTNDRSVRTTGMVLTIRRALEPTMRFGHVPD